MEQIRLDNQLPVKKNRSHLKKGTSSSGKSVISVQNPTIWDMRDSRRHWCLIYCKKSSLSHPFVLYQPVRIAYRGTLRSGCSSPDFLKANQMLIPLEKLYRQNTGDSLAITLAAFFRTGGTHSFSGRSDGTHDGNSEFRCISDRYAGKLMPSF